MDMFCPNCGASNNKKQNYCRFCGLNLRDTAKSLTSQIVFGEDSSLVKSLGSVKRSLDFALAALAGVVIVSAVAYFFFKSGFGKDMMKFGVIIFFLLETVLGAVGYYQRKERSKARATNKFEQSAGERIESKETARLLEEKPFEPLPSVVENTTELLPLENKTRRLE
jgi:uncharacterized membrane protein YvbJ